MNTETNVNLAPRNQVRELAKLVLLLDEAVKTNSPARRHIRAKVAAILGPESIGEHNSAPQGVGKLGSNRKLAERVADDLFRTSYGEKADLLGLIRSGRYLGGWCKKAAVDRMISIMDANGGTRNTWAEIECPNCGSYVFTKQTE